MNERSIVKETIAEAIRLLDASGYDCPDIYSAGAILGDAIYRPDEIAGAMAFFARDALERMRDADGVDEVYHMLDKILG